MLGGGGGLGANPAALEELVLGGGGGDGPREVRERRLQGSHRLLRGQKNLVVKIM